MKTVREECGLVKARIWTICVYCINYQMSTETNKIKYSTELQMIWKLVINSDRLTRNL